MRSWGIAIDIGVDSVVAATKAGSTVKDVRYGREGTLPASVYFGPGQPPLTGPEARERAQSDPAHAVLSPRYALTGDNNLDPVSGIPITYAYAALFSAVRQAALTAQKQGNPDQFVLLCPAAWSGRELAVMYAAAQLAGLPAPQIMAEPIAAAQSLSKQTKPGQLLAVFDVAKVSSGATILRRTQSGFEFAGPPGGVVTQAVGDSTTILQRGLYELLATITNAGASPQQLATVLVTGDRDLIQTASELIIAILGVQPTPVKSTSTAVRNALSSGSSRPAATPAVDRRLRTAAIALIAIILIGAGTAIAIRVVQYNGHGGNRTTSISQNMIRHSYGAPDSYKVSAQYPAIEGLPNAALQQRINAELLESSTQVIREFTKAGGLGRCPSPGIPADNCGYVSVTNTTYLSDRLLSVKYYSKVHFSGAGDYSYQLRAITLRLDNGRVFSQKSILTSAASSPIALNKIADKLQELKGISGCDEQPGWPGEENIPPALSKLGSKVNSVVLNVMPQGIEFSFGDDVLSGTACTPVGTLSFAQLSGFVNPTVLTLSQG
jgi:hypothetical protein